MMTAASTPHMDDGGRKRLSRRLQRQALRARVATPVPGKTAKPTEDAPKLMLPTKVTRKKKAPRG